MNRTKHPWLFDLLFLLVLVLAGYLRLTGVDWGEGQGQHPDENTFSGVLGAIRAQTCIDETLAVDACPLEQRRWLSPGEYFNSQTSPLNPYNRGYGSFVYGNLPMNLIRVVVDASGQGDQRLFGRQASAFADLFAIFFLYLLVARLYDRRVALLAALFSSLAVMQIQQAHFFTTDLFVNTFAFLAIYFVVEILKSEHQPDAAPLTVRSVLSNPLFQYSLGFGVAYGMALASKLNIYPLAVLLPGAFAVRWLMQQRKSRSVDGEQAAAESEAAPASFPAEAWLIILTCLVAGGFAAILSFRIFQPYAFDGLKPDPRWVADITQQRAQATGEADMPWNLQWARRSHLYSFTNMTVWGLGLPLGILAWIGFLYMGWRILKGEWQHALLWGWTAAYFGWQSLQFNPTMRYQLPIYPLLAMMAAWVVFEQLPGTNHKLRNAYSALRTLIAVTVIALTAIWAFAFHSIYLRDEPRIAASRWIYQNVPGPVNLQIADGSDKGYTQPLPFPNGFFVQAGQPYQLSFTAHADGLLNEVTLPHVLAVSGQMPPQFSLTVWDDLSASQPLTAAPSVPSTPGFSITTPQLATFDQSPILNAGQTYYLKINAVGANISAEICGPLLVRWQAASQLVEQKVDVAEPCTVTSTEPFLIPFIPDVTGALSVIALDNIRTTDLSAFSEAHTLSLVVTGAPDQPSGNGAVTGIFAPETDPRGVAVRVPLEQPLPLVKGQPYTLYLSISDGAVTFSGAAITNETSFDYGLPMRTDGYDAFGGLYRGDLNLEVYWDDNADKLNRFVSILDQTDYIFIPTNHQYGQISRVTERYPLTAHYYRELMGCPPELETIPCYYEAQPGDHQGRLGFDLVAVFETYPRINLPVLGEIEINDQYAEEAFTFYDHPKVLVFKKNADFSAEAVRASLGTVDLTKVVRLLPTQFDDFSTLMLPAERLASQRAGGTWSDLFNYTWIQNRYPLVGLLIWYAFILLLGLATYPIIRKVMPGLADKGYPLSRAFGLLLFGYFAWLSGSVGIPNTRLTIAVVFFGLLLTGGVLAYRQRDELKQEWAAKRSYFLMVEGLFLLFFLVDLFIRYGNPDLWHPGKGGERPMDFSYFNAVIKSTSFPPYDPWFAGGYINYYYYGFVLVATPVKLLGIVPSIAYNFILPTLFATVGICAFSLGWNLLATHRPQEAESDGDAAPFTAGLSASFLTILLGNLGTLQLFHNRLQQMGALGTFTWDSTFAQRLNWTLAGLKLLFSGATLPIGPGDWYWDPSRVIPPKGGNEITEFPLFTFLYSDLHAHMLVMPIALLAISWALSVVASKAWRQEQARPESERWWSALFSLVAGGLIIGAVYPTNLSDSYTYLLIGIIALTYAVWRYADTDSLYKRLALTLASVAGLYLLSKYLYLPYRLWYGQAYSALDPWNGPFTPLASYFTHWGLFLFIIVSWLAWETREWMANTPLSALKKLKPYQLLIEGALIALVILVLWTQYRGTSVGWVALPLAAWAGVLLLNPRLSDSKRLVSFLVGTALFITVLVDVVVVRGDIGRANTIFKFYLQAWLMLAVSSGAMLAWLFNDLLRWLPGWRGFWQTSLTLLVAGAAMFTITGTMGKIQDRWIVEAPRTLDAMGYMAYANYDDFGRRLDLSEDYRAIRWMQEHVQGSPVIVEANCPEYRWCTRFTMYTGLPGVVGWNFHQRQQRVYTSVQVEERVASVGNFYNSIDPAFIRAYLKKYDIRYIVVGQVERAAYTPEGIAKFEQLDGTLWKSVYRDGATTIYEVLP